MRDNNWKFWDESKEENALKLQILKIFWFFLHLSASRSLPAYPLDGANIWYDLWWADNDLLKLSSFK